MVGGITWFSCVTIIKLTLSWTKASELKKISAIPLVTWDHCLQFIKTMVWKHQLNGQKGKTKYQYEGGKHTSTLCFGKPYWLFATPGIKQVILVSITEECDEYFVCFEAFLCAYSFTCTLKHKFLLLSLMNDRETEAWWLQRLYMEKPCLRPFLSIIRIFPTSAAFAAFFHFRPAADRERVPRRLLWS